MKITYDAVVDAAYITFKTGPTEVTTIHLTEDIAIDLGPGEEVVGIEVLDASRHLGFNKLHPEVTLENVQAV